MEYHSKVRNSVGFCKRLVESLQCGVDKADRGSTVEDDYVREKIRTFADLLGYNLVKKQD